MSLREYFCLRIPQNEKPKLNDIIKKAAKLLGIGHSTFARAYSLKEAKKIIKELGENDS